MIVKMYYHHFPFQGHLGPYLRFLNHSQLWSALVQPMLALTISNAIASTSRITESSAIHLLVSTLWISAFSHFVAATVNVMKGNEVLDNARHCLDNALDRAFLALPM